MRRSIFQSLQGVRSSYMLGMQFPVLPEALLSQGAWWLGLAGLGIPPAHKGAYAAWLRTPGACTTAIAAYRALPLPPPKDLPSPVTETVTAPTTYVWGEHDLYLGRWAAERTGEHCRGDYRFVVADGDHWLPEKRPELVADEVIARVRGG